MSVEHVELGEDGRVVIPAAFRKKAGLKPGDTIVIESSEYGLTLKSYNQVLSEVQAAFAPFRKPSILASEELIAERRAEAIREASKDEA